jgi:hypothetical protein
MMLGTCILYTVESGVTSLLCQLVSISGHQDGYIVGFTVRQVFQHDSESPQDVSYIVPNNSKICIYGTVFRVRGETIRATLQDRTSSARREALPSERQ